jgi:hypothetical protein
MNLTRHAQQRMQQRGINLQAIDYVLAYGREVHNHHGGCIIWLDKRCRQRIAQKEGDAVVRNLHKHLNVYVIVNSDGKVITVGHRYRRIVRH